MQKKSFLARLTGLIEQEEDTEEENGEIAGGNDVDEKGISPDDEFSPTGEDDEDVDGVGELAVDVFQKPNEIVVKAMVAGVKPEDLDVALTREMVTIKGKRERERHGTSDEYAYKELYWGSFSRSLVLPEEVDVDSAEANVQNGLLIIRLPKIDKKKTQKLKILKA